jgi:hypothetical protein
MFIAALLTPGSTTDTVVPFENPLGQPGLVGTAAEGIAVVGLMLHVASLLAALLCVVLRFRSSRGIERQQMRWVAAGAAVAVIGLTVPLGRYRGAWLDPIVVLCVPAAVAVAVLRYRLWDLDRLINRTVKLRAGHRPAGGAVSTGRARGQPPGRRLRQPGRGRRHPDGGRAVPAAAPPRPGPGGPALQPPPL